MKHKLRLWYHQKMHKFRLWYHRKMFSRYAKLTESVKEDPKDGMTERGELVYLDYYLKMMHHESMLKEMGKGA